MSLHLNLKLKIPETTAIVANVGTMRKELAGCIHRFVGSFAVLSSYYHRNCLLPVTLKRAGLFTIDPFSIAYHRISMYQCLYSLNSFSADKLGNEYFLDLQSHSPSCYTEFLGPFSCGKSGSGLLRDHVGTFFLDQCWGQGPENSCNFLLKCMWAFLKLFLYSRD